MSRWRVSLLWAQQWLGRMLHVLLQLFLALDQLAGVLLALPFPSAWRGTWADETLSSRAYRADRDGKVFGRIWRPIIDALFFWQPQEPGTEGHCHGAYLKERARYSLPPELRTPTASNDAS